MLNGSGKGVGFGSRYRSGCRRWHLNRLWLYEATVMRFGRGFDSRQLHHYGAAKVSTGRVAEVDSRRGDRPNRRKTLDANDDVYEQAKAA